MGLTPEGVDWTRTKGCSPTWYSAIGSGGVAPPFRAYQTRVITVLLRAGMGTPGFAPDPSAFQTAMLLVTPGSLALDTC